MTFLSLHSKPEPRPSRKGWSVSGCCVAIFCCQIQHRTLKTERPSAWDTRRCPPSGRAGKRRWKGAGNPCRENGAPNINWSKWPVDVVNDAKRHSPEEHSALRLTSCGHFDRMRQIGRSLNQCRQFVHIDSVCVTFDLDLTFCQATVKSGKC